MELERETDREKERKKYKKEKKEIPTKSSKSKYIIIIANKMNFCITFKNYFIFNKKDKKDCRHRTTQMFLSF
jgi:hypothetical protein